MDSESKDNAAAVQRIEWDIQEAEKFIQRYTRGMRLGGIAATAGILAIWLSGFLASLPRQKMTGANGGWEYTVQSYEDLSDYIFTMGVTVFILSVFLTCIWFMINNFPDGSYNSPFAKKSALRRRRLELGGY